MSVGEYRSKKAFELQIVHSQAEREEHMGRFRASFLQLLSNEVMKVLDAFSGELVPRDDRGGQIIMGGSRRKLRKRHVSFRSGLGLDHDTSERVLNINRYLERRVAGERR